MAQIVRCPRCSGEVQIPHSLLGEAVVCPRCEGRFTAPAEAASTIKPTPKPVAEISPAERKYCTDCGTAIRRKAVICTNCGVPQADVTTVHQPPTVSVSSSTNTNRIPAGIFAILLGCFGVHKFILGYTVEGVVMLLVTLIGTPCAGVGFAIMWVIGLIEGIIYLCKSDAAFHTEYEVGRRGWF